MRHDSKLLATPSPTYRAVWICVAFAVAFARIPTDLWAAGGDLNFEIRDESSGQPTIARMELTRAAPPTKSRKRRAANDPLPMARTVGAGRGFVVDGNVDMILPDGSYQFRITRGLESRVLTGNFAIERTSSDAHSLNLPRIIDLRLLGWTSGDCYVPASINSLPMRMAAEDLHLAMRATDASRLESPLLKEKPIPGRALPPRLGTREMTDPDEKMIEGWPTRPIFIDQTAFHIGGLVFYADDESIAAALRQTIDQAAGKSEMTTDEGRASDVLAAVAEAFPRDGETGVHVAIENPLAQSVPIWLATGRIDGVFVLGDWIRLDKTMMQIPGGHVLDSGGHRDATSLGRDIESVYWQMLAAGLDVVPLAGCGDEGADLPVGTNRLYVAGKRGGRLLMGNEGQNEQPIAVNTSQEWWAAAWAGRSVATNGPLLQPTLGGRLPGHRFELRPGQPLSLSPELTLAVRDPVDYLEVIHDGRVHYSARLDEYAKSGGQIPPIPVTKTGWAVIRVVTLHETHFQAAMTAAWYFDGGTERTASPDSISFFANWLSATEASLKTLSPEALRPHIRHVRAARAFWRSPPAE